MLGECKRQFDVFAILSGGESPAEMNRRLVVYHASNAWHDNVKGRQYTTHMEEAFGGLIECDVLALTGGQGLSSLQLGSPGDRAAMNKDKRT